VIADLVADLRPAPHERPWWNALREHRLTVQQCANCEHRQHFPRMSCEVCGSRDLSFADTAGLGTVASYSTIHRAPFPSLQPLAPYTIALVDLDEGVRLLTALQTEQPDEPRIGMRVAVSFVDVTPELTLPVFRPHSLTEGRP
jgi:uncharacterized protein